MSDTSQLYFGGDIYTVDSSRPRAEALTVRDGIIVAVGSEAECRAAAGVDFEPVDLKGKALLPGFIDTHLHPILMIYFDMNLDLHEVKSIGELQDKFRDAAHGSPPGKWIVGLQFDEQILREQRFPTRRELDAACPNNPVVVVKHDGHMVIANTGAIEAAGISAATPDPPNGVIDREPGGYPSGPFRETAAQVILSAMPMPDIPSFVAGAAKSFGKLLAHGITSAGVVLQTGAEGPAGKSGSFDVLALRMLLEHIPVNTYGMLIADNVSQIEAARKAGLHDESKNERRIGAIKIYSDGAFGACTACMDEPYTDQPDKSGFMALEIEEIYRRMSTAHNAGLQICIHAIGDKANRNCVELFKRLFREFPRPGHRHRIEHASQLDAGILADIARLKLIISTQPMFIHSEKHWLHKRLGAARTKWTYPFRSILDAGVVIAGASDAPVESTNVIHAIQCCVTREGLEPQQSITAAEAVRMFTIDAAYAQFEESIKGSLAVGKRADMVILNANPVSVAADNIVDIRVEQTIVGGKVLYKG